MQYRLTGVCSAGIKNLRVSFNGKSLQGYSIIGVPVLCLFVFSLVLSLWELWVIYTGIPTGWRLNKAMCKWPTGFQSEFHLIKLGRFLQLQKSIKVAVQYFFFSSNKLPLIINN